jgi:hypothetical protein
VSTLGTDLELREEFGWGGRRQLADAGSPDIPDTLVADIAGNFGSCLARCDFALADRHILCNERRPKRLGQELELRRRRVQDDLVVSSKTRKLSLL